MHNALRTTLLIFALAGAALAQQAPRTMHAKPSLLADISTIAPGQPFTLAIVFKLDPKWHVYYKNPGDSGLAPSVKWTLTEGVTAGELQFPKPEVLKTPAGTNFVYHDEVALLVPITTTDAFKLGQDIELIADLKWLECDADACLPAKQRVSITLHAADQSTPTNAELFAAWRVKVKEAESFDPATAK